MNRKVTDFLGSCSRGAASPGPSEDALSHRRWCARRTPFGRDAHHWTWPLQHPKSVLPFGHCTAWYSALLGGIRPSRKQMDGTWCKWDGWQHDEASRFVAPAASVAPVAAAGESYLLLLFHVLCCS